MLQGTKNQIIEGGTEEKRHLTLNT